MNVKLSILIAFALFSGCMYGDTVALSVTKISAKTYPPTTAALEIYFDDSNNHIDRPYEQIAMLEVRGEKYSNTSQLLEEMKKKATALGADGIVAVKQHYIARQRGELLGELLDREKNKPETYDTIALTAIAFKYK